MPYLNLVTALECNIADLCIHRHDTLERQYVVLHLASLPHFGVYDYGGRDVKEDKAGFFQGTYIKREEYDDGYAIINGEVVEVAAATLRWRNFKNDFMFLVPQLSVLIAGEAQRVVDQVYKSLIVAGKISSDSLQPLEDIVRPDWMGIFD